MTRARRTRTMQKTRSLKVASLGDVGQVLRSGITLWAIGLVSKTYGINYGSGITNKE